MNNSKCTSGEATVARINVLGEETISVGIIGTKKVIAICGIVGGHDEAEAESNAVRIATAWNLENDQDQTRSGLAAK